MGIYDGLLRVYRNLRLVHMNLRLVHMNLRLVHMNALCFSSIVGLCILSNCVVPIIIFAKYVFAICIIWKASFYCVFLKHFFVWCHQYFSSYYCYWLLHIEQIKKETIYFVKSIPRWSLRWFPVMVNIVIVIRGLRVHCIMCRQYDLEVVHMGD